MRKDDIYELLEDVDDYLATIADKYTKVKDNPEIKEIVKGRVKSSMEHLRSCLDYCLHDIDEQILKKHRKTLYFPYKNSKNEFKEAIKNQFKGLKNKSPEIYSILESVQDFNNQELPWLNILCKRTNVVKHDKLLKQKRQDNQASSIPGLVRVSENAQIKFDNVLLINDKKESIPMNFTLGSKGVIASKGPIDERITIEKINWVTFTINGTNRDVLEFLTQCRNEIGEMVRKIYREIEN